MIASLRGILAEKKPDRAVLDVNGVGYEVHISARTYDCLPEPAEEVFLIVHTAVREDAITLFGFAAAEEKELFLFLNGVSGIGPRLAMAVLSGLTTADLLDAIGSRDTARLTAISGVGKKTAQRICMELQDKVAHMGQDSSFADKSGGGSGKEGQDSAQQDAVSALINLGYPEQLAWQALRRVAALFPDRIADMAVQDLIREALKALA